ncbi:hypothetical protein D3C71_2093760 [compost metagenome]
MGANKLAHTTKAKTSRTFDTLMITLPMLHAIALPMTSAKPAFDESPGLHSTIPPNPMAASRLPIR